MKTIIEFKDGHIETVEDVGPMFNFEEDELDILEKNMTTYGDTISIQLVKKVTWEND